MMSPKHLMSGQMNSRIEEIERRRTERHRLVDQEQDALIKRERARCVHEPEVFFSVFTEDKVAGCICKHCGEVME